MSDRITGRRIVPAPRYTNDVTFGLSVKRFDGFESGHFITLLDAKYNLDSMNEGRKSNLDLQRAIKALKDNPEFKGLLEMPKSSLDVRLQRKLRRDFKVAPDGNLNSRKR